MGKHPEPTSATLVLAASGPQARRAWARSGARPCGVAILLAGTIAALLPLLAGCGREGGSTHREAAVRLPLEVLADTGTVAPLGGATAPAARAWLASVSTAVPAPIAPPDLSALPREPAAPAPPPIDDVPPDSLTVDDDLRPPIPRGTSPIRPPASRGGWVRVELDVQIDEAGTVSEARWAGGSADSAAVHAARASALAMTFHPAMRSGRPVAVWCRQRYEFGGEGARLAPPEDR